MRFAKTSLLERNTTFEIPGSALRTKRKGSFTVKEYGDGLA
jgi:hypothetical protein